MPGAEPIQNDGDKPVDGSLGWQGAGCRKRVQAVACQLIRRDVIADLAGPGGLDQQALDQVAELLLRPRDVLMIMTSNPTLLARGGGQLLRPRDVLMIMTMMMIMTVMRQVLLFSMQESRELPQVCAMVAAGLVGQHSVGFEHRRQPLASRARLVADASKLLQVSLHLPFVPGSQNGLDIRKVLVERGAADAGGLGDLRHRHRRQPVLSHQRRRRVQDGVAHLAAVRRNRLAPQLRHDLSIQGDEMRTLCLDKDEVYR